MTEEEEQTLLGDLDADDWSRVREAIEQVGDWLRTQHVDDLLRSELASRLLRLSSHSKWEVRKAVAHAVLFLRHDAFPAVIARIVEDENAWVREAARKTLQRRSELSRADIHGDSRGDTILGLLSALEARYGLRARRAALNVADHLHHRFVREAYHEIVRIISPLDASLLNLEKELQGIPGVPDHTLLHARRAQARVRLITEFLDNLRAFTTEAPAEFALEALVPIVKEAAELALSHVELPTAGIDVRQKIDGSLNLEANRSRLLQALINIIVNAVEACLNQPRRGVLIISATPQTDTHVRITVADNGCGMSEEALRDCVLLYSSGKANGMGFGLPLAKKIIEIDHQGTLSIESREGVGTTVTVVLPVEQARSED
ncbi:MAG: sensor histidine kinase [Alphaproteobacteria bacterium]|nr:sensor histidine kinase [Alphaproteobacteria bacterium]